MASNNPTLPAGAFYDKNQPFWSRFWSRDYVRFGFWEPGTRSLRESFENIDRCVAANLALTAGDRVLDAGCGVGGTAFFLARQFGVEVVGINISMVQLRIAESRAKELGLAGRVSFSEKDYTQTGFAAGSFRKMYAIESVYHAQSKQAFADEAVRVLADGGTLVVVDRFLAKDASALSPTDAARYDRYRELFAVPNLPTVGQFDACLKHAGFKRVSYTDRLLSIQKTIDIGNRWGWVLVPLALALRGLGLISAEVRGGLGARCFRMSCCATAS